MNPKLIAIDRVATLLTGLALVAGGLALIDWKYEWVFNWDTEADTTGFADLETTFWWPWAYAAAAAALGLVGLVWLMAHVPRRGLAPARLSAASNEHGEIRVDLDSVANAAAEDFQRTTPVDHVKGTARRRAGHHVIEIRGQITPLADGRSIEAAAARCAQNVSKAFPDGTTTCRVLLGDRPRIGLGTREGTPRVH